MTTTKLATSRLLTRQDSWDSTRLDSTRLLCWCARTASEAVVCQPQSDCRVFVSLTRLDWTQLDSVCGYAPLLSPYQPIFSEQNVKFTRIHLVSLYFFSPHPRHLYRELHVCQKCFRGCHNCCEQICTEIAQYVTVVVNTETSFVYVTLTYMSRYCTSEYEDCVVLVAFICSG
jgi:hypothetical protein